MSLSHNFANKKKNILQVGIGRVHFKSQHNNITIIPERPCVLNGRWVFQLHPHLLSVSKNISRGADEKLLCSYWCFECEISTKATPLGDYSHLADKKRCDCLVDLPEGKAFDTNVIMYEYLRLTVSLWVQPPKIFTLAVWRLAPTFGKPELNLIGYWLRYMFPSLKWGNSRPHSTQDSSFGNAGKRGMKHRRRAGSFL